MNNPIIILSAEESLERISAESLGRIVVRRKDEMDIFPVNFVVAEGVIYFRTAEGNKGVGSARHQVRVSASSWVDEYGHPEDPAFQMALSQLSPYHNLSDGSAYPPALITTSLSDDRVHPAHALKFYAKLKHNGSPAWLYAGGTGGHTGNTTQEESVTEFACILAFLNRHIGTEQQEGKKEEAV